ncbi:MAG TPA: deoxyhypusine synthase [Anaerolineae bacterium]|nr:deoxyhypusine synthase [Anaerolineae bacterium]
MENPLKTFNQLKPKQATGGMKELVDGSFLAYNSSRLREACHVFIEKYSTEDVTVGVSVAGAMTPAGIGVSCLVPLMKAGFMDWMVITGANLYHDLHFALGQPLYQGSSIINDCDLKSSGVVRIYDIFFEKDVLLQADVYVRDFCLSIAHKKRISSAEFSYLLGKRLLKEYGKNRDHSVLMTAAELGIPLFTSAPGDSALGMNMAVLFLKGTDIDFGAMIDVNLTSAIVYGAKKAGGRSGVLLLGGGSPKNFILQTEPYIQEILGFDSAGHDYFIQFTDARADTGGLSGATPAEAVSWWKISPDTLPDSVVCYGDTTVLLPILVAYVLESGMRRTHKRLYDNLDYLLHEMKLDFMKSQKTAES